MNVIENLEYGNDGVVIYVDKYLDNIFTPQGDVKVDDLDELDEAYRSGDLSKEQYEEAFAEGDEILQELCTDIAATEQWRNEMRFCVRQKEDGRVCLINGKGISRKILGMVKCREAVD